MWTRSLGSTERAVRSATAPRGTVTEFFYPPVDGADSKANHGVNNKAEVEGR